jgi:polar amino acid transport system permease protein
MTLAKVPWWAVIIAGLGLYVGYSVLSSEVYLKVIGFVMDGVKLTLKTTLLSFALALVLGLIGGLGRVSKNPVFYAIATLYVEVIRGLPMLVIILYVGFVIGPWVRDATRGTFDPPMLQRAILGLGFGYGAYLTEVYRAGIQSIHRGQMEAARSLGMTYFQAMRYIILPQAFRVILPPLVNDLAALLKDTSLIAVIALPDLLQMGRLYISRTFRAFEGYNTVALLYLVMTLVLSSLSRILERRVRIE